MCHHEGTDSGLSDTQVNFITETYNPMRIISYLAIAVAAFVSVHTTAATLVDGDDWSLPAWVVPTSDYVFFNENSNAALNINNHVIDVTWKQINPAQGVYSQTNTAIWTEVIPGGSTFSFDSFANQKALPGHYWLRIWLSGEQWIPSWVLSECNIPQNQRWLDHSQQDWHRPLWNTCVWGFAKVMYQQVFQSWGVAGDPNFEFAYVPGGFFYAEFDFDVMWAAFQDGSVSTLELLAWLADIRTSLTTIMGDQSRKLMYTGQDYPFAFQNKNNGAFELHARDAVNSGMGIRNGITEVFNFHLNETPAYGSHIQQDGHVSIDENAIVHRNNHVIGNENECFNACGFSTIDPYYAVVMANLKALQLRSTHLLVEPTDSYLTDFPQHWNWVQNELGKKISNAPDAWVALREYEDKFFIDNAPSNDINWINKPWLHNFERWLIQKDIPPNGMSTRGSDVRINVLHPDNGTSFEGRMTDRSSNQDYLYFFVDDNFTFGNSSNLQLKITFLDTGSALWQLQFQNNKGQLVSDTVTNTNTNTIRTATFDLPDADFDNGMPGAADFRIYNGGSSDIEIRFARLIRLEQPTGIIVFSDSFE